MTHYRIARRSNQVVRHMPGLSRAMGRLHARLYLRTGGRFVPRWFAGAPILVLHTVGRRTGKPLITPLLYLQRNDAVIVMAANAGADRTPAWWLNLHAAGHGTIVVGRRETRIHPRELAGSERDQAFAAFVAMYPQASFYGRFTDRVIPLIALEEDAAA